MSSRSRKKVGERSGIASAPVIVRLESWARANHRRIIGFSLGLNLLLCLALFDPKLHTGGDNASYIILARSILTPGAMYSQDIYTEPPKPETLYPFGYPLLLAPVVAVFGPNVIALKTLSVLFALGTVWLFSLLALRLVPPLTWAVLTLTIAVNPIIVEYSHWILSEIAFLFFSVLTIYLMVRAEDEKGLRPGRFFFSGLLSMAFTVHIRSIGIAFPVAGFIYLALKRSWRRLAIFTVVIGALLAPWTIRNHIVSRDAKSYGQWLLLKNPYSPEQGSIKFSGLPARALTNFKIYSLDQMARVVLAQSVSEKQGLTVRLTAGIFSLLVILGLIYNLKGRLRLLEMYILVYLGVVLIWPEVWSDVRFIMAIIPFFMVYLADSLNLIRRGWSSRKVDGPAAGPAVALLVAALLGFGTQLGAVPDNLRLAGSYLRGDHYAGYPINWRQFFEAADWIRDNTPKESVITVRKPTLYYLTTGHKVFSYPFSTNADSVLALIRATDYVVVDAVSGTTARYLVPAILKAPQSFKLVYDKPYAKVLEVIK